MKIEELAVMNALVDRVEKMIEGTFKALQEERKAERAFILECIRTGSQCTLDGIKGDSTAVRSVSRIKEVSNG
jgi:hypothetical protein